MRPYFGCFILQSWFFFAFSDGRWFYFQYCLESFYRQNKIWFPFSSLRFSFPPMSCSTVTFQCSKLLYFFSSENGFNWNASCKLSKCMNDIRWVELVNNPIKIHVRNVMNPMHYICIMHRSMFDIKETVCTVYVYIQYT